MAVTFGFYDSIGGDRPYTADQMGAIFDGIVNDGIYQAIGDAFAVKPKSGMQITVGSGRCWFNHTWTENNDELLLSVAASNNLQSRIDTVVIQIDKSVGVRANSIRIIQGAYSSSPVAPTLSNSGTLFQYPLANINVKNGATSITASDITNLRGRTECPWVTGPLEVMDASDLYDSWTAQYNQWAADINSQWENRSQSIINEQQNAWNNFYGSVRSSLSSDVTGAILARLIELEQTVGMSGEGGDYVIWDSLRDQNDESILSSAGAPIEAKVMYSTIRY